MHFQKKYFIIIIEFVSFGVGIVFTNMYCMIQKENNNKKNVDPATRAMLIRKGNQFFSENKIEAAEKIFVTVDYKDGLVRLGDYYFNHNDIYKAAYMYFMSGNESKIKHFSKLCAQVIKDFLCEDTKNISEKIVYEKKIINGENV